MASYIQRRKFLATLPGGAAAWPRAARAQQSAMPVIGFLRSSPAAPFQHLTTAFRQGLNEAGFVEGQNVAIEYCYADNQLERLPGLVTELIRLPVAVIVANVNAALAAKAATTTVPDRIYDRQRSGRGRAGHQPQPARRTPALSHFR